MTQFQKLVICCGISALLTGCATFTPKATAPAAIQQQMSSDDLQQLNLMLDTAKDNQPMAWHSSDGKTMLQLTTSNTYVNAGGEPCRSYNLLIAPSYHRKQSSTGVACRGDNDQWQLNSN